MSLKIVHFSKTCLAGGPFRLVRLLQKHTNYDVRLIDLERWGRYPHDLVYTENQEEALALAEKADIIHFHNYLDYNSQDFSPINFNLLRKSGTVFVRQFRSESSFVAKKMGISVSELLDSPIPSIVIAQYPERFYPDAQVVPNAIPSQDSEYSLSLENPSIDLLYSPTKSISAWDDRWNTKGAPETIEIIKRVQNSTKCSAKIVSNISLSEVLSEKRKTRIVLDDLVTGSYHMSGVEAMCLGKAVLSYIDNRIEFVLREITGSDVCPFVNVRLEDAQEVLMYLLKHPNEVSSIGRAGREWIDCYWSEKVIAEHYIDVYEKLIQDPSLVRRQDALRLDTSRLYFHGVTLPDLIYSSRANCFKAKPSFIQRAKQKLKFYLNKVRQWCVKHFPLLLIKFIRKTFQIKRRLFNKSAIFKAIRQYI